MNELTPFEFRGTPVRIVFVDGEPRWVVSDVAKILGYRDAANAARLLRAHQQGYSEVSTPSGTQRMMVCTEGGVNRLIMRSNAQNAEEIQDWFTDDVLTSIRRTGSYVSGKSQAELVTRADLARMVLESEEEKKVLEAALDSAAPAIAYHDRHIAENDDLITVKTWGAQFGLTEPQAYNLLKSKNIVYKLSFGERWSRSKGRKEEVYEYRARAGRVTFEWFEPRPQHNAPRHHNGQVKQTLYVKQFFGDLLADKCGLQRQMTLGGDAA